MRRLEGSLSVAVFVLCICLTQPCDVRATSVNPTATAPSKKHHAEAERFPADIQKILDLPESKIDTGLAALTFAKEIYPEIDVAAYSARIDALANGAALKIQIYGKYDPDSVIRALNTYYHFEFGVRYDKSEYGRQKRENYFLNGIMDTRQGQCMTMPMLYMAIAQRLGYPIYAVWAPEHSFLRYVDSRLTPEQQNIDVSGKEIGSPSNANYAHNLNISKKAIEKGAYLRTLTRREWLGILLMENGVVFMEQGRFERAVLYFEKARELDPRTPYYVKNLSHAYRSMGFNAKAAGSTSLAEKYRLKSNEYYVAADDLGWTYDPDELTRGRK